MPQPAVRLLCYACCEAKMICVIHAATPGKRQRSNVLVIYVLILNLYHLLPHRVLSPGSSMAKEALLNGCVSPDAHPGHGVQVCAVLVISICSFYSVCLQPTQ